jgi:hypothetical protein
MLMVVDWSFWTTVIGIIATVVFGIWAILLAKKHTYPGEITFFHDRSIRLFDDITGSLPQVTVSYKGGPVKKNLTLIKGFLVNTGSKDITKEMVETPLTFELFEGYRWLEASAKLSSGSDERAAITNPKTVVFSLGLFRCNEFLRFEGLIEVSEGKAPGGKFYNSHRIADTSNMKWKNVPEKPKKLSKRLELLWSVFICFLFGFNFLYHADKVDWTARGLMNGLLEIIAGILLVGFGCLFAIGLAMKNRFARKIRRILRLDSD